MSTMFTTAVDFHATALISTPKGPPARIAARRLTIFSSWRVADRLQRITCSSASQPRACAVICAAAASPATAVTAEAAPAEAKERTAIGASVWEDFAAAVTGEWEGVTVTFNPAGEDGTAEPQELPPRYVPNDFACAILRNATAQSAAHADQTASLSACRTSLQRGLSDIPAVSCSEVEPHTYMRQGVLARSLRQQRTHAELTFLDGSTLHRVTGEQTLSSTSVHCAGSGASRCSTGTRSTAHGPTAMA